MKKKLISMFLLVAIASIFNACAYRGNCGYTAPSCGCNTNCNSCQQNSYRSIW